MYLTGLDTHILALLQLAARLYIQFRIPNATSTCYGNEIVPSIATQPHHRQKGVMISFNVHAPLRYRIQSFTRLPRSTIVFYDQKYIYTATAVGSWKAI